MKAPLDGQILGLDSLLDAGSVLIDYGRRKERNGRGTLPIRLESLNGRFCGQRQLGIDRFQTRNNSSRLFSLVGSRIGMEPVYRFFCTATKERVGRAWRRTLMQIVYPCNVNAD